MGPPHEQATKTEKNLTALYNLELLAVNIYLSWLFILDFWTLNLPGFRLTLGIILVVFWGPLNQLCSWFLCSANSPSLWCFTIILHLACFCTVLDKKRNPLRFCNAFRICKEQSVKRRIGAGMKIPAHVLTLTCAAGCGIKWAQSRPGHHCCGCGFCHALYQMGANIGPPIHDLAKYKIQSSGILDAPTPAPMPITRDLFASCPWNVA
jgi:hypothetical protein